MNTVTIRNTVLGTGRPKICLPVVGRTLNEIETQTKNIMNNPVDIVEWRADWFDNALDVNDSIHAISSIREIIGDIPLLYTIRTSNEGGELTIPYSKYMDLLPEIAEKTDIDAIDVEILISDTNSVTSLISSLKKHVRVIASSHDFDKTPASDDIVNRLIYMEKCGADICKMAVMPHDMTDVITLLNATSHAHEQLVQPLITMSMGKYGLISRLSGEIFGSCLTFGCAGKASAPGQIPAEDLDAFLALLHKNL